MVEQGLPAVSQHFAADPRRGGRPTALGQVSGINRSSGVGRRTGRNLGDHLTVGRVEDLNPVAVAPVEPLATDEHLRLH